MTVRLLLFGSPTIEYGGDSLALPFERRSQLLVFLALKRSWVGRAELAALLWPEQDTKLAYANLRKTVFRLQSVRWSAPIEAQGAALRTEVETDVSDFERALQEQRIADALLLRRGELLAGFDDDGNEAWSSWLNFERDRLRVGWRTAALDRLAAAIDPGEGIALSKRLLEADPLDEAALRHSMAWLARAGQASRAREIYRDFSVRLSEELGLTPGAELKTLHDSIGAASAAAPATPTVAAFDDGFVGRTVELRQIAAMLSKDDCRLLCVTGPGGVGKTTLARRVIDELAGSFVDGAAFVPLEDIAEIGELGGQLARELDIPLSGSGDPIEQVIGYLRDRQMLLVLDNFEHLAAGASILERLLAGCTRLKFLVTSRVRLALASERLLPLVGLPCPEAEDEDRIEAFDAARLFVRAAQRVEPALVPSVEAAAIVDICRQVEGLPLALELAAAWTRVLSCDAIAAELRQGAELLHATDAAQPARHASMDVVFEQSWRLLSPVERDALARLTAFHGGFSAEAARDVAGASLPVLAALADKSLLRKEQLRIHLHPLVQQLASVRLGAGDERSATEQAHARYFNDLLHQLRRPVENGDRNALAQVDAEFENCRLAWRWAATHHDAQALANGVHALTHYCDHRSRLEEGLSLLREALACLSAHEDPKLVAMLLGKAAHMEYRLDRYADAMATATRGLEILRGAPEADAQAQCLKVIGTCELRLGRLQEARRHFEQSLKLAPACSDLRHRPAILSSLALVQKSLGNYGEALRLSLEALEQQRGLGDVASEALSLNNLAALHIEQQEYASAGEYLNPALVLCDRHGLVTTRVYVLANLTGVAMNTGETAAAEEYARRAMEHAQAIGNRFVVSYMRMQFVRFALRRGDLGAARAELRSGMELAIEVGRPALLLEGLTCLAEILAAQGEAGCAHMVATFAANHPSTGPLERDVLRRYLQRLSATDEGQMAWPGLSLDELTHRIVVETNLAYAPLIATLRVAHSPA